MKNKILVFATALFLFSCSNGSKNYSDKGSSAKGGSVSGNSVANYVPPPPQGLEKKQEVSSSAARVKASDSNRKFIRTADLKFQAKNVIKATYGIEDIAGRFDGFVTYTNLTSNINSQTVTPVGADSSVESTFYNVTNTMTIRVPNTKLDTMLKSIAVWIDFLDYRTIKADDVGLQILANKLSQKRNARLQHRLTNDINTKGRKLTETSDAEENVSNHEEQADNAMLSNLSLADQINYSTINLNIYQRQEVRKILIANDKSIKSYEPGFGHQIVEALKTGWYAFEYVLLFFIRIWWLVLASIAAVILYRRLQDKPKKQ